MNYGFISLSIPVIVIVLAIVTKRIISSLIVGILAGGIMLAGGNIIQGRYSSYRTFGKINRH